MTDEMTNALAPGMEDARKSTVVKIAVNAGYSDLADVLMKAESEWWSTEKLKTVLLIYIARLLEMKK